MSDGLSVAGRLKNLGVPWPCPVDFRAAYDVARRTTFMAGISRVHALTPKAVETLEDLLDARPFPRVRLGAARTIAEIAFHQHDAETILRKLDEIEAAQRPESAGRR